MPIRSCSSWMRQRLLPLDTGPAGNAGGPIICASSMPGRRPRAASGLSYAQWPLTRSCKRAGKLSARAGAAAIYEIWRADLAGLPDGSFVRLANDDHAWVVSGPRLLRWSHDGYDRVKKRPSGEVEVLTPKATVAVFRAGSGRCSIQAPSCCCRVEGGGAAEAGGKGAPVARGRLAFLARRPRARCRGSSRICARAMGSAIALAMKRRRIRRGTTSRQNPR